MKIGSQAHKELFCRSFITSHREYEPEQFPWPDLDDLALERLRGIPFWLEALSTEQEAGVTIDAFAATVSDPLVREAIALQGKEESRHARLIQFLIQHYGIKIPASPAVELPDKIEPAFIKFGYNECVDSFLAFGIFKLARLSNFFPEPLFTIFDTVLDEEAGHIVFFVNWFAYLQASQGQQAEVLRAGRSLWYYGKAVKHLIAVAGNAVSNDKGSQEESIVAGASSFIDGLTPKAFLSACLEENTRRMSHFDDRLLQPRLLSAIAKVALSVLNLAPQRQPNPEIARL